MTEIADTEKNAFSWTKGESKVATGSALLGFGVATAGLMASQLPLREFELYVCMAVITLCFMAGVPRLIKGAVEMLKSE